jgi:hypothetical protein
LFALPGHPSLECSPRIVNYKPVDVVRLQRLITNLCEAKGKELFQGAENLCIPVSYMVRWLVKKILIKGINSPHELSIRHRKDQPSPGLQKPDHTFKKGTRLRYVF